MKDETAAFLELVEFELSKARAGHGPMTTQHEAYAVIKEELDEFWDEVKAKKFNREEALGELVQIAAMAQRAAEDLGLVPLGSWS